ncbi:hypothetical protein DSO57_1003777 [Entomophthora muscae]|uniref:Uncharacterized protein n=1 Tax=Entomophthora muscae TaxID=34485 RepID=A0ACC2TJF4_9FUNG|nr:hypothetical protein DSO57_1003777 [Entomophthora muscae]
MACLKEVGKRPTTSPANKYQLLPVSSPERVLQLASSGDMVNNRGKTKYCHFCSPEPAKPGPAKQVPLRAQTYAEVVAWTRPTTSPASKHQLLPVPSPERGMQLASSCDMVNHSGKIKHYHFCLPEQTQPGPAALKTLIQDPCPASKTPMDLKPAKNEEAKSHVIFHLNFSQVDNQVSPPPETNLLTCLRHYTVPLVTIFPCCTKKSAQKPTKPLNYLEDLAHTVDEIFVLAYPSQVSGYSSAKLSNSNSTGLNGDLHHSFNTSQSELEWEIIPTPSSFLDLPCKISLAANQTHAPGSVVVPWILLSLSKSLEMLVSIFKFVVFTLSPPLLFIWSTSLDLWEQISSSVLRVSDNPSHLLYFAEDFPGRAQDLITYGKHLVKSLTCDDLHPSSLDLSPGLLYMEDSTSLVPPAEEPQPIPWTATRHQAPSTQCTPWLLAGMTLMGFNSYFSQLSPHPLSGLLFEQPSQ